MRATFRLHIFRQRRINSQTDDPVGSGSLQKLPNLFCDVLIIIKKTWANPLTTLYVEHLPDAEHFLATRVSQYAPEDAPGFAAMPASLTGAADRGCTTFRQQTQTVRPCWISTSTPGDARTVRRTKRRSISKCYNIRRSSKRKNERISHYTINNNQHAKNQHRAPLYCSCSAASHHNKYSKSTLWRARCIGIHVQQHTQEKVEHRRGFGKIAGKERLPVESCPV